MVRDRLFCWLLAVTAWLWAGRVWSQEVIADDGESDAKTVLYDNPWISARADGMGGALGPVADGMDAPYYNPAGIGGIYHDGKSPPNAMRFLGFPYAGMAVGEDSISLYNQFLSTPASTSDPVVTKAVLDAHDGKRQYARFSLVPSVNVSRFMLGYVYDNQVAAVRLADLDTIRTRQSVRTGPAFGFSAVDPGGTLYLGVFAASLTRKELNGDLGFGNFVDPETRQQGLDELSKTYSGTTSNAGILWRVAKKGNPTLSLVAHDLGDTTYSGDGENVTVEENLSLGFGLSPRLGKWGYFSWTLEADRLMDPETAVAKKLHSGLELTFGDTFGWASGAGIRLGGHAAGASFGIHANIGLIGIQLSSKAEDIGIDNDQVIERRHSGVFSINVAH